MSSQQQALPWYKNFFLENRRKGNHASVTEIITQAEHAFESGQLHELISLIFGVLGKENHNVEQELFLRCLLNEALCELSRYDDAAKVIQPCEVANQSVPDKLQAELLLRLGATCCWLGQYPKAIAKLNEAVLLFVMLGDREGIMRSYFEISILYVNINEYAIARDYLLRALSEAEKFGHRRLTAQILLRLGMVDHYEGNFVNAKQSYNRALKLVEGSYAYRLLGSLQMNLANTLFLEQRGSADQIIVLYENAIENFKLLNNSHFIAHCYNNLGDCLLRFGMWEKAQMFLSQAIELARTANYTHSESLALITLAELNLRRGELANAKRLLMPAIKIAEQGDKTVLAYAKRVLGYAYGSNKTMALKSFNASLQLAITLGDHNEITFSQLALCEYYYSRPDFEQARGYLKQAQERLSQKPSPYISGFAQRLAGLLKMAAGEFTEAIQHITSSISIFTTVGDLYEVGRSHLELAASYLQSDNREAASSHIKAAREILNELKARPDIVRAEQLEQQFNEKTAPRKPIMVPSLEQVSDLTIVKRLAQACITVEILLEEFAVIFYELFNLRRIIISQPSNEGPGLLLAHGCNRLEAKNLLEANINYLDKEDILPTNIKYFRLTGVNYAEICLYLETTTSPLTPFQQERLKLALEFVKLGLDNCVLKTDSPAKPILGIIPRQLDKPHTLIQGFVYASATMCRVVDQIKKIRSSDVTVLITGESGTGKELVARAIHAESARREGPFVAFNCTATPRELIESQLFGHRRGSFTGATSDYLGVIRTAKGGTLFLDEIGDLNLDLQPKLLRFLEAGEIQPLGEGRPLKVDVRVIAATNADLAHAVAERRFREDLYHRLNIIRIHIPALRERPEEIPMLLRYYLDYLAIRYGDKQMVFSEEAVAAFQEFHWPGNVRQLRNEIERLITYSTKGEIITMEDLSPDIRNSVSIKPKLLPPVIPVKSNVSEPANIVDIFKKSPQKLRDVLRPLECEMILAAFERNKGIFSRAAQDLGLSRRGLRLKIENLGINVAYKEDN